MPSQIVQGVADLVKGHVLAGIGQIADDGAARDRVPGDVVAASVGKAAHPSHLIESENAARPT
jgi:hypothetical protein